jgi:hypothetical protein
MLHALKDTPVVTAIGDAEIVVWEMRAARAGAP